MTAPTTIEQLSTAIRFEASNELTQAMKKIEHCLFPVAVTFLVPPRAIAALHPGGRR